MENKKSIFNGSMIAGAIMSLTSISANAATLTNYSSLGTGGQVRSELLSSVSSFGNLELKCGENKTKESKCGEDKSKEAKCGENKGKEAKCGEKSKKDDKKKEGKGKEAKCGEGKCGEGKKATPKK